MISHRPAPWAVRHSEDREAAERGAISGPRAPGGIVDGQRRVELGRPKQRALLAVLLVHANQVVALDRLIEELWGEEQPAQASASLQAYVSHLRRVLEPGRRARTPPRVLVTAARVPAGGRARGPGRRPLCGAGRAGPAAVGGRPARGRPPRCCGRRWGCGAARPWPTSPTRPSPRPSGSGWKELRLDALEDRLAAELALGRHGGAAAELRSWSAFIRSGSGCAGC